MKRTGTVKMETPMLANITDMCYSEETESFT